MAKFCAIATMIEMLGWNMLLFYKMQGTVGLEDLFFMCNVLLTEYPYPIRNSKPKHRLLCEDEPGNQSIQNPHI